MKRLGVISLFVILFVAFLAVWNISYRSGKEEGYVPIEPESKIILIPSETGVFKRSEFALDYANMPVDEQHQRSLQTYYKNRAYHGAPPSIPHPVASEISMGENVCLKCHQNGGFVEKFNAYAPVTPHPEMVNCRQCHVAQVSETMFAGTSFYKAPPPEVGNNNALPGSPPIIPHQIQMHENCLSCHAGPSAPKEIRVTHPERVNCRQCHVLNNKEEHSNVTVFKRMITNETP
ncbi:nitrate reductase cytochrome c-type subunit [Aestuariibaculum suncheonense]|uniref:Nitrate reductase cytochrome c-type subunit n=1 Tax=Aestuariibaculum suncheonense TaxID=1028745 RepID=A0A8J6QU68_9FLAO|nr:nitrate reductase cytochrome c-type subunit [Aestuariibaculum suncheonense]MBD0835614.1 nitrate reductase cytochrome c-type subunit [Aestuariibaculum suncheonense]